MGLVLQRTARTFAIVAALAVFVGLPLLLYAMGDTPRRTVVKELISLVTLLALSMMLGQYFLARSNETLLSLFKPVQIQTVHKYIAYSAVAVILAHPFLIVLPRYFEAGVRPWDAFIIMLTTFDNRGILLGLGAWFLILLLAVTTFIRRRLIPRFKKRYPGWRYFHGALAVTFTVLAVWHAIELGRHTDVAMSTFFTTLALLGFALLAKLYWGPAPQNPRPRPVSAGASHDHTE